MSYRYARRWPVALAAALAGAIALAASACDRARVQPVVRDSVPPTVRAAGAPAETVVRRVVRVLRRPSAIQRVTQDIHVLRAGQPLDTQLVVRVYDQRGVEIAGAQVRWTLVAGGDGATFDVINARTDTLGLSRAAFVPGASADSQHVVAEVDGVGRIDFGVVVPAATLRVRLSRPAIWSGDDAVADAELRDVAGRELSGGQVSWGSMDTTIARSRSIDGSHARVTGVGAGTVALIGWVNAGKVQGTARITVKPVVAGSFVTLDGRAPPPMRLELISDAVQDSLTVVGARFGPSRIGFQPFASVEFRAEPANAADAASYSAVDVRVHAQRDVENLRIALVPTVWRIDSGTYAGRDVPIDARRAMQRTAGAPAFWRLAPISGTAPRRLLGWRESDLPLRIAFNRARSSDPVTANDSAAFWAIAERMQRDLGMRLFVPAELAQDSDRANLVPVEIGERGAEGETFVSWAQAGDAMSGVLVFRRAATLGESHVVTHELAHLLGFGHTNAWSTVALPSGGTEPGLTPGDVAYIQLAYRLRRLQHETGARPGLPLAAP